MDHSRLNYKIFKWSEKLANRQCKNWSFKVVTKLEEVNLVDQVENSSRNIIKKFLKARLPSPGKHTFAP